MAGAYPFLAEQGLGSAGVLIGTDLLSGGAFVYDPWVLYHQGVITNPNVLLAGVIGTGKSALAKSLTTRSLAFGVRVYVPGDPKGEWTPVARAVGGVAITLGHGLDAPPQPPRRRHPPHRPDRHRVGRARLVPAPGAARRPRRHRPGPATARRWSTPPSTPPCAPPWHRGG